MKKHNGYTSGFTLIEVLIVIFIISIATSVALLSIGHNENKKLETFANELTQVVSLAEEQALLQPTLLGIAFNENSFEFLRYKQDKDEDKNEWVPLDDSILGRHKIPSGVAVEVKVQNDLKKLTPQDKVLPQIIFSTNGDITPFTIQVGKKGKKPRHVIIGDADGHLTRKNVS